MSKIITTTVGALPALKGHLTCVIKRIEETIRYEHDHGPSTLVLQMLETNVEEINARSKAIEDAFFKLTTIDPTNADL